MMSVWCDSSQPPVAATEVSLPRCWQYDAGPVPGAVLYARDARVYVGTYNGRLDALTSSGSKLWTSEFGGSLTSNLVSDEDGIFFVTSSNSPAGSTATLHLVSVQTGITVWSVNLPAAESYTLALSVDEVVVITSSGKIIAKRSKDGGDIWTRDLADKFVAEPIVRDGSVTVASANKQVLTVSLTSGEIASLTKISSEPTAIERASDSILITGDDHGNVSSVSPSGKTLWLFRTGGSISALTVVGDEVLVSSNDNFVYSLKIRNGAVTWKRRLAGRPKRSSDISGKYALVSSSGDQGAILTDDLTGRVVGRVSVGEDEVLSAPPVSTPNNIFLLTKRAVYSFGIGGCGPDK